jgi:quinol monooxygenase YgiN
MVVVVGRVKTDADRREALIRVGQAVAAASRQEPGCISYRLYEDTERENEFVFVEEWESNEALQRHFATPHIAEFMGAVPDTLVAAPDVKFHTIAETVDLADIGDRIG